MVVNDTELYNRIIIAIEERIRETKILDKWYYDQGQYHSCVTNKIKAAGLQEALDIVRRMTSEK